MNLCINCKIPINVLMLIENDSNSIVCDKCGIINQIVDDVVKIKRYNLALIKSKIGNALKDDLLQTVDELTKLQIAEYAVQIGPHLKSTLMSFILLYLEYKNQINFTYSYKISKKQRKYVIKCLINITRPDPTIFIRTPITYISFEHLGPDEVKMYKNVSFCLIFLNVCNKKNLLEINQEIMGVIKCIREGAPIVVSKAASWKDIVKLIVCYNISVDDLKLNN